MLHVYSFPVLYTDYMYTHTDRHRLFLTFFQFASSRDFSMRSSHSTFAQKVIVGKMVRLRSISEIIITRRIIIALQTDV